jgi:hypothetical protein
MDLKGVHAASPTSLVIDNMNTIKLFGKLEKISKKVSVYVYRALRPERQVALTDDTSGAAADGMQRLPGLETVASTASAMTRTDRNMAKARGIKANDTPAALQATGGLDRRNRRATCGRVADLQAADA